MTGSAARFGGSPGPVLSLLGGVEVPQVKPFRSYVQQVELLVSRGMQVEDIEKAARQLEVLNYYRLSGYWHSMRLIDPDTRESLNAFRSGASFDLAVALYDFDERLRNATFAGLARIELAVRALIGYHLGAIDPLIHLHPALLGASAKTSFRGGSRTAHDIWLEKYWAAVEASREDFVVHHRCQYGGQLPIWVAVELMDWGMLSHLYRMSPNRVRNEIAAICHLRAPQLESWLKSLNILRNYTAHHARVFNRVFDIKPKLPSDACFDALRVCANRAFGQLTLVQYLLAELDLSGAEMLPTVLSTFPHNDLVPFSRLGAPQKWQDVPFWETSGI